MANSDSTTKNCTKCGEEKPATDQYFNCDKNSKSGLTNRCKLCAIKASKEWREANPERVIANVKNWQALNADKVKQIKQRSADKHREQNNAKLRDRWMNDPVFRKAHSERVADWESKNPGRANKHPLQRKARTAVSNAIRLGKLAKPSEFTCVECGAVAKNYHHISYEPEFWLQVIPVCTKCHGIIHRGNGNE